MNVIALETSSLHGSVACFSAGELLETVELCQDERSARALIPCIARILRTVMWKPQDIDLIAVTIGPGSFTGLRIGVTAAKTLAYATQSQTIGVNTLDALAHQAIPSLANDANADRPLHVVMDAQRKQFFWVSYKRVHSPVNCVTSTTFRVVQPATIIDQEVWLANRATDDWVTGPGLRRCRGEACVAHMVDESLWSPTAVAVGQVGMARFAEHGADDLWQLAPEYYRKSAAEEKHA